MYSASYKKLACLLSLSAALCLTIPLSSTAADPAYVTAPSGYRAGDTATVSGHHFTASSSVWLEIIDPAGGVSTQTIATDNSGSFKKSLSLPQAGEYRVKVHNSNSGAEVSSVIIKAAGRL